jgi:hypothetical protein
VVRGKWRSRKLALCGNPPPRRLAYAREAGQLAFVNHYHQVLLAEQDDLAVRRFYVAYKCATDQTEERAKVLTAFVGGTAGVAPSHDATPTASAPTNDIIKDLLMVLTKKL